jgi:hypothetical protein
VVFSVTVVLTGPVDAATLASLSAQRQPGLDVVVVADAELDLPKPRPESARVVVAPAGRDALRAGLAAAAGDVVVWLDRPAVLGPDCVAALARRPLGRADAVSVARAARCAPPAVPTEELADRCAAGTVAALFAPAPAGGAEPVPIAFRRELGLSATAAEPFAGVAEELAYRLEISGADLAAARDAQAWVVGGLDPVREAVLRGQLPWLHRPAGRVWPVPLVVASVDAAGAPDDAMVRACVDGLLAGAETDLVVHLAGAGAALAAEYAPEPRVRLVDAAPATAFPSPYLLKVPPSVGVGPAALGGLLGQAARWRVGRIRVLPAGSVPSAPVLELVRAGATGERWETGEEYDVASLVSPPQVPAPPVGAVPEDLAVLVAGPRSLARATVVVGRTVAGHLRDRLRVRLGL